MVGQNIYQEIFKSSPLARLIIDTSSDYLRVIDANQAAADYLGCTLKELCNANLDTLLEAANKDHLLRAFKVSAASGVPVTAQLIPVLPGSVRIQSFHLNPLAGGIIDMMARPPVSDEDALRRERDDAMSIFTSMFDASDVGILVTDHNRRIVRVNNTFCKVYGWQPINLIGSDFLMLLPEHDRKAGIERHNAFMVEQAPDKSFEVGIQRGNGELANVIASSGVIELSGKRKFRITTIVDITHLKNIESDLRRARDAADAANRAKSAFLANMSHELRTPLNAVIGFSDLMLNATFGEVENPQYKSYIGDIHFSATHLLSIINDVLDMSKIEAGGMKPEHDHINIHDLLSDTARLMLAKAGERGITIDVNLENLPDLTGDERMVRQVFLNLLSNAVKFSHENGVVSIDADMLPTGDLAISVTDRGVGIPEDRIEEALQPFGQVGDPRIAKGQGTGLGLPLARTMLELHGGSLAITSAVGQGTVVTCQFPRERLQPPQT